MLTADFNPTIDEINSLVDSGTSFGFAMLPGENIVRGELEVGRWLEPYSSKAVPGSNVGLSSGRIDAAPMIPSSENVYTKSQYLESVSKVIASCQLRNGKTVFSREITGQIGEGVTPGSVFWGLCDKFPDSFRYIFYIPREGVWIGATPEILLNVDLETGEFSTMALAGTRKRILEDVEWDEKNIVEQRYVVDYISSVLSNLDVKFILSELYALPYGDIEHLCRMFTGKLGAVPYSTVLDALNPTPALCGWPKDAAIADINRFESHQRSFYGGFVAQKTEKRFCAYANLRCLRMIGNRFSVYSGGGITAQSDPLAEYFETEAKAAPRIELLRPQLH